jgi:RimJ/RimL family protein N-acetyltransferase
MTVTPPKITELRSSAVSLLPFITGDYEYLLNLGVSNPHTKMSLEAINDSFEDIEGYFWTGWVNGKREGVTYLAYHKLSGIWSLDGYTDGRHSYGYEAGKLAVDFFFDNEIADELYIICPNTNRPARMLAHKLGFHIDKNVVLQDKEYWLMKRRK